MAVVIYTHSSTCITNIVSYGVSHNNILAVYGWECLQDLCFVIRFPNSFFNFAILNCVILSNAGDVLALRDGIHVQVGHAHVLYYTLMYSGH